MLQMEKRDAMYVAHSGLADTPILAMSSVSENGARLNFRGDATLVPRQNHPAIVFL